MYIEGSPGAVVASFGCVRGKEWTVRIDQRDVTSCVLLKE